MPHRTIQEIQAELESLEPVNSIIGLGARSQNRERRQALIAELNEVPVAPPPTTRTGTGPTQEGDAPPVEEPRFIGERLGLDAGVPVQALRNEGESRRAFLQRIQFGELEAQGQDEQRQREAQALGLELGRGIGSPATPQQLAGVEPSEISQIQGLQAGLGGALPGTLTGLGTGFISGGVAGAVGGPVTAGGGALLGAIIGFAGSFYRNYQSNINTQTRAQIATIAKDVEQGRSELNRIIGNTWAGGDKNQMAENFQTILAELERQELQLNLDVRNGVNLLIQQDGTSEVNRFRTFNTINRPRMIADMRAALASPIPDTDKAAGFLAASGDLTPEAVANFK